MNIQDRIVRSSEEHPYVVLLIVGFITVGMIYGVTQISMSSEMEEYLPEEYASVKISNEIENEVGGTRSETILIEGDNLISASNLKAIIKLKSGLAENKTLENYYSENIQTFTDYIIPPIENKFGDWRNIPPQVLEKSVRQLLNNNPKIRERTSSFLSENRTAALIMIRVNSELNKERLYDLTEKLDKIVQRFDKEHKNLTAGLTGSISMEMETQNIMNRDNKILIPVVIIVIMVILFLVFRRLSDTALPFLVLGLGATWVIGTMGLLNITFTMVYVALVPVLLGVGIDYTIHMLNRYYEERERGYEVETSSVRSVRTVGVAIALTAITTIIGFFSFGTSSMPPIRNFGLLAGSGVLYIFALTTMMLPSLIVLRDRGGEEEMQEEADEGSSDGLDRILSKLEIGVLRHKKPVLIVVVVVTAICAASTPGLSTSMSFNEFLPGEADSVQTSQKMGKYFGGRGMQNFVLVRGDFRNPGGLATIQSLQESIENNPESKGLIKDSKSIVYLIQHASGGDIPQTRFQVSQILSILRKQSPDQLGRFLLGDNQGLVYFSLRTTTDKEMERATQIIRDHVRDLPDGKTNGLKFTLDGEPAVGGSAAILSDILNSILPNMRNSIILAIILVIVVLGLVFRSAKLGLIGCLPVVIALLWEFGAIRALGWSLNVMNMMVSALAIGIGVDFTIHVTHRFMEEWNEGESPEQAMSTTIRSVGRAIIAAASTTIGAFLVLSLSRMPPVTQFGQLAALVILFSLFSALTVLPALLLAYTKVKERT